MLVHFGHFLMIEVSHIFGGFFFTAKVVLIYFDKILGEFFTNSSGHPAVTLLGGKKL
jgi:hypothetical protein